MAKDLTAFLDPEEYRRRMLAEQEALANAKRDNLSQVDEAILNLLQTRAMLVAEVALYSGTPVTPLFSEQVIGEFTEIIQRMTVVPTSNPDALQLTAPVDVSEEVVAPVVEAPPVVEALVQEDETLLPPELPEESQVEVPPTDEGAVQNVAPPQDEPTPKEVPFGSPMSNEVTVEVPGDFELEVEQEVPTSGVTVPEGESPDGITPSVVDVSASDPPSDRTEQPTGSPDDFSQFAVRFVRKTILRQHEPATSLSAAARIMAGTTKWREAEFQLYPEGPFYTYGADFQLAQNGLIFQDLTKLAHVCNVVLQEMKLTGRHRRGVSPRVKQVYREIVDKIGMAEFLEIMRMWNIPVE